MKMKTIRKKILPIYFDAVESRQKNFEIRKDEDDVQIGDKLVLGEWKETYGYTGRFVTRKVKYVLRNVPEYGLKEGYCVIGW